MIQSYLFPISYAFMAFPFAALLFTLPFLVVQYRRHGYINKVRAFVLYLFLLYLMNAVFLVMLPFPSTRHNPSLAGGAVQGIPFNFIQDILKETTVVKGEPSTYWRLIKERAFLQVVFNVFLTIPFGMFIRYYFRSGAFRCLILSFLLSLFIEITQLTGIYGVFDHAYRVFDIDDLMTNTLGGMIGFLAAEWLSGLLPRIEHLDKNIDLSTKRVSYTRRGLAWMFDIFLCVLLTTVCYQLGIPGPYFVATGLYFMLLPYLTGGCTFGKWLVRIRLTATVPKPGQNAEESGILAALQHFRTKENDSESVSLVALIVRYGLLYWVIIGLNYTVVLAPGSLGGLLRWVVAMFVLILDGWFFIHFVKHLLKKDSTLFYEKISGTHHRILFKQPAAESDASQS
ncbi:VanZ family protein [Paenibacillus sanfengchensis]|uniref:VanZ family protein n=1 Tax=Paenibacillus sanfengchensis TaxID=3119819 RepID=UPI002FE1FC22